jgi:hypothetical protein
MVDVFANQSYVHVLYPGEQEYFQQLAAGKAVENAIALAGGNIWQGTYPDSWYNYSTQLLLLPSDFGAYSNGVGLIVSSGSQWEECILAERGTADFTNFGARLAYHAPSKTLGGYHTGWHLGLEVSDLTGYGPVPTQYPSYGWSPTYDWVPSWLYATAQRNGSKMIVWEWTQGYSSPITSYPWEWEQGFVAPSPKFTLHRVGRSGGVLTTPYEWVDWSNSTYTVNVDVSEWYCQPGLESIFFYPYPYDGEYGQAYPANTDPVRYTVWPKLTGTVTGPANAVLTDLETISHDYINALKVPYITPPWDWDPNDYIGEYSVDLEFDWLNGLTSSYVGTTTYMPATGPTCDGLYCWIPPSINFTEYCTREWDTGGGYRVPAPNEHGLYEEWGVWYLRYDSTIVIATGGASATWDQGDIYAMGIDFGLWIKWTGNDNKTYGIVTHNNGSEIMISGHELDGNSYLPPGYDVPPMTKQEIIQAIWNLHNGGVIPEEYETTAHKTAYDDYDPEALVRSADEYSAFYEPRVINNYGAYPPIWIQNDLGKPDRFALHVISGGGSPTKVWEKTSGPTKEQVGLPTLGVTSSPAKAYGPPPQVGYLEDGPNPRYWGISVYDSYLPNSSYYGPNLVDFYSVNSSETHFRPIYQTHYGTWNQLTGGSDPLPWITGSQGLVYSRYGWNLENYLEAGSGDGSLKLQNMDSEFNYSEPGWLEYPVSHVFFERVGPGAPELRVIQKSGGFGWSSIRMQRYTWNEGSLEWEYADMVPDSVLAYPTEATFKERYDLSGVIPMGSAGYFISGYGLYPYQSPSINAQSLYGTSSEFLLNSAGDISVVIKEYNLGDGAMLDNVSDWRTRNGNQSLAAPIGSLGLYSTISTAPAFSPLVNQFAGQYLIGFPIGSAPTWPLRLAQRDDGIYGPTIDFTKGIKIGKVPNNSDGIRIGYQAH